MVNNKLNATLIRDDCVSALASISECSVDLVIADLPYAEIDQEWDKHIDLQILWPLLLRAGTQKCKFVFFATFRFATTIYQSNPKLFRYDLVWRKNIKVGFLNSKKMPLREHELVLVFARKSGTYNPQFVYDGTTRKKKPSYKSNCYGKQSGALAYDNPDGKLYPGSVNLWPCDKSRSNSSIKDKGIHPTQKPQSALEWLVKTYSNEGDTILDPAMGGGSTGMACLANGRDFIGIESNEDYFKMAVKKIGGVSNA